MHIPHWVTITAAIVLLVVATLAIVSHEEAAVDKAHHDEQIAASQAIQKANDKAIKDLKDLNSTIAANAQDEISALQKQMDRVTTAQQAAANIRAAFPTMQQPITREDPKPGLPDAPGAEYYRISGAQLQTFYACGVGKQQCEIRADAAEHRAINDEAIIAKKDSDLAEKDKEIKAEKDLNHGGSLGRRIKRKIKPVLCGAGGAALGVLLDKNHPVRGGAVGSIAGGVGCSLF